MKVAKPTSAHFRERARHYRLAEAIADAPRDVEMFHDLATLFERLSEDFARMVHGRSGAPALDDVRGPADGRSDEAKVFSSPSDAGPNRDKLFCLSHRKAKADAGDY